MSTQLAYTVGEKPDESRPLINDDRFDGRAPNSILDQRPRYEIFFVVMPLFCGYACLFALQHYVKLAYNIADNNSSLSHDFGTAASLVYIGNFVFRLGHNVLFAPFEPRTRVLISMACMFLSMGTICLIFFVLTNPSLFWVFLAYGFGGTGIGTFESNLLSTITPLGKQTKFWAILAIPTGVVSITVGGFIVIELGLHPGFIYAAVCVYLLLGLLVFLTRFYNLPSSNDNAVTLTQFVDQFKHIRNWFPQIQWHSLALMLDMFCVSMFAPGVMLFLYDSKYVTFPGNVSMSTDWMFVMYDAGFFIGDSLSRRIFYPIRIIFPLLFLLFSAVGIAAALSNMTIFVPFAGFFIAFCNGSIYAQANRKIDATIDKEYNLIAFSFWLFIGDIGSVIGSNTISYVDVSVANMYSHHH